MELQVKISINGGSKKQLNRYKKPSGLKQAAFIIDPQKVASYIQIIIYPYNII